MDTETQVGTSWAKKINNVEIMRVDVERLDQAWPHAKKLLEKAPELYEDCYTLEDIYDVVAAGYFGLWLINDEKEFLCVGITEVIRYPRKIIGRIIWCIGKRLNEYTLLLQEVEKQMLERGANELEIIGRDGWVRKLAPLGYKKRYVVLTKELRKETIQ